MEKMDIKVDDLLEGTMNKILEAGDTASFERARCTVNLLGETVSVYAFIAGAWSSSSAVTASERLQAVKPASTSR